MLHSHISRNPSFTFATPVIVLRSSGPPVPIYTVNLLLPEISVINSETLVPAVQRNSTTILFDPMVEMTTQSLSGSQLHELADFKRDASRAQRQDGLAANTLRSLHTAFGPGPGFQGASYFDA